MKNCKPLCREAHSEVKMSKAPFSEHFWKLRCRKSARRCGEKHIPKSKCPKNHSRSTFGSCDVEKVPAVVARSTFRSQNVQSTILGALLEVAMSKKCPPLWREAHFEVKMYKAPFSEHFWKLRCRKSARRCGEKHIPKSKCPKNHSRSTFGSCDVEKVPAVVARSTFRSQNVQSTILGALLEVAMSKKCPPLWREAHFEVKMYKAPFSEHFWKLRCRKSARRCGAKHISKSKCTKHHSRSTFGSCDVEKVPAVVARSTFRSQNVQSTILGALLEVAMSKKCPPLWREAHFEVKMHKAPFSEHFWKLRCRKSDRRCGAKHISKSKCTKHHSRSTFGSCDVEKVPAVVARSTFRSQNVQSTILGALLEVAMSKKCTPLWREAHFEVKMYKAPFSEHFWKLRCRKSARRCGAKHISKSKCTKHHSRSTFGSCDVEKVPAVVARSTFRSQNVQSTILGALLEVAMSKKCPPLWREAHFEVKMYKAPFSEDFWKLRCRKSACRCGAKHISKSKCTKHHSRSTFGSCDVEKVPAVVARSTFRSQNVQSTILGALLEVAMSKKCPPLWREAHFEVKMYKASFSEHFWKLRCRKSARRCQSTILGALLEVAMSKKCSPLWREAHFEVKMYKAPFSEHFWKLRCRKSARRCGAKHISKSKCTKHHSRSTFGSCDVEKVPAVVARSTFRSQNVQSTILGALLEVAMSKKCLPLWREAHFEVKMYKAPFSEHFWKLRCRKSARRCGAKHISKSKW